MQTFVRIFLRPIDKRMFWCYSITASMRTHVRRTYVLQRRSWYETNHSNDKAALFCILFYASDSRDRSDRVQYADHTGRRGASSRAALLQQHRNPGGWQPVENCRPLSKRKPDDYTRVCKTAPEDEPTDRRYNPCRRAPYHCLL